MQTTQAQPSTETRIHSAILRLGDRCCSIPVDNVREMAVLPEVRELCGTPPYVPGVITMRGQAIPVVDLRMRLGMGDIKDDSQNLQHTLQGVQMAHNQWFDELEACINSGSRFNGPTDSSQSQFTKWLANFEGHTREIVHLLSGFEDLLKEVHSAAREVLKLASSGDMMGATTQAEHVRNGQMRAIEAQFERLFSLLEQPPRVIVTVIEVEKEFVGVIVDEVAGLAWVRQEDGDISKETSRLDDLFASMGRNESNSQVVSMLDPRGLRVHHAM